MSLAISMINLTQCLEVEMTLRCKHGDLAVIVGEYPGCEANIGRIVQVRGPAHLSEQSGELLCWVIRPITRKKMINLYIPDILSFRSVLPGSPTSNCLTVGYYLFARLRMKKIRLKSKAWISSSLKHPPRNAGLLTGYGHLDQVSLQDAQ